MLLKYETLWGVGSSAKSLEYFDKGGQRRGCELSRGGRDMRAARGAGAIERLEGNERGKATHTAPSHSKRNTASHRRAASHKGNRFVEG